MTAIPTVVQRADPDGVEHILRSLPEWFGIDEAIAHYVAQSAILESHIAVDEHGATIGVVLVERHFPESAEIALIAVHGSHRGAGVGRLLIRSAETSLMADDCAFLEAHTVGPSYEHKGYAATRAFYKSVGFSPLHEFDALDWDGPTLVMIKKL